MRNERRTLISVMIGILIILCFLVAGLILRAAVKTPAIDTALIVNGEKISLEEIRRAYVTENKEYLTEEEALDKAVNAVINYHLLLQEAERRGIAVEDEEVEKSVELMAESLGMNKSQFLEGIQEKGITIQEFRKKIREELTVKKLLQEVLGEAVSNEELSEIANPEGGINYVVVRQIFLSSEKYGREELVEEANKISDKLKNEDFCNVAREYGQNCTAYIIMPGTVFEEYENAAFGQKTGETSIVASERGVHFVQTVGKGSSLEGDRLKGISEKMRRAYEEFIKELRRNAEIENFLQK